jgi:hypothetical protein
MVDLAGIGGPFVLLLLLTFGLLMAVLGVFLLLWSRGAPRVYGAGFLVVGVIVLAGLFAVIWTGDFLPSVNIILDVVVPGVLYFLAIAIGAVLAIVPFLVAAIRT